jgi:hypothetical protein
LAAALALGSTMAAVATSDEAIGPISEVTGALDVEHLPGGTFEVHDRVFQYRDYHVAGLTEGLSDPRLAGDIVADWSWDVHALGDQPMPAWGTMKIAAGDGAWEGTFTGIRYGDLEPMGVRAFLFGTGAYEGLCATLDISASGMNIPGSWVVDGVVHPVPMAR